MKYLVLAFFVSVFSVVLAQDYSNKGKSEYNINLQDKDPSFTEPSAAHPCGNDPWCRCTANGGIWMPNGVCAAGNATHCGSTADCEEIQVDNF